MEIKKAGQNTGPDTEKDINKKKYYGIRLLVFMFGFWYGKRPAG